MIYDVWFKQIISQYHEWTGLRDQMQHFSDVSVGAGGTVTLSNVHAFMSAFVPGHESEAYTGGRGVEAAIRQSAAAAGWAKTRQGTRELEVKEIFLATSIAQSSNQSIDSGPLR